MDVLYLDNIDEYINDHNKIVTYKWLSLALGVHVNLAKQMLYHYLDKSRKDGSKTPLHATYLVSGKCVQNGGLCHKVSVVREDQLEDTKSRMDSTISIHVYSLQKAEIKDSGTLYSTDYDAVRDNLKNCNKYSAIHCEAAVPMSAAELELIQDIQQQHSSPEKPSKPTISAPAPAKAPAPTAAKTNAKASKGIMGMFANKAPAKTTTTTPAANLEVKQEKKEETPAVEASEPKPSAKTTAMNKFFGTSTKTQDKSIKKESEPVVPETSKPSPVKSKQSPPPAKTKDTETEKMDDEDFKPAKKQKEVRSKTKRLDLSDSDEEESRKRASQSKKRRRIKKQLDSSDDEDAPAKPAVVTPPSPERQVKLERTSTALEVPAGEKIRKRRRVLKSKTFLDDEGCIVTEKAYESESYSESEEMETSQPAGQAKAAASLPSFPPKSTEGKKSGGKKSSAAANANKSTKQASIMGFFQKK
ncbi:DNA polymerase delta subunit 3 [Engraulis encrasicolus]|uniref:DNA polymerase delta subunit 3 n=1 Tax=Engraulis encrasicolus TaxID=184585 RepID=UPI002FCE9CB8